MWIPKLDFPRPPQKSKGRKEEKETGNVLSSHDCVVSFRVGGRGDPKLLGKRKKKDFFPQRKKEFPPIIT